MEILEIDLARRIWLIDRLHFAESRILEGIYFWKVNCVLLSSHEDVSISVSPEIESNAQLEMEMPIYAQKSDLRNKFTAE